MTNKGSIKKKSPKSEKYIEDNQSSTDISYLVIDAMKRSGSETDFLKNINEITETNDNKMQKYSSLDSKTEEIQLDDDLISIMKYMNLESKGKNNNKNEIQKYSLLDLTTEDIQSDDIISIVKYLTLENKGDNNNKTFYHECEDIESRSRNCKSSIDIHKTTLPENLKHVFRISPLSKIEFDNKTSDSSQIDQNMYENNVECLCENCKRGIIRKLTGKLILLLSASLTENTCNCKNKWQKWPKKESANINILESSGSKIDESNLSKATGEIYSTQVNKKACSSQNYENNTSTPNPEFQMKSSLNFQSANEEFSRSIIKFVRNLKNKVKDWFALRKHQFHSEKNLQKHQREMSANSNVAGSEDSKIAESNLSHAPERGIGNNAKGERIFDEEDIRCIRKIILLFEEVENDWSEKELERALEVLRRRTPQILTRARASREAEMNSYREEHNQTLKQKSPEIIYRNTTENIEVIIHENTYANDRDLKTEKQISESSYQVYRAVNLSDARQQVEVLLHDNQIADLCKRYGETNRTLQLNGHMLLGRRSQPFETQNSRRSSKGKKKPIRGQSGMIRRVSSKRQAIPAKHMTGKLKNKECLNENRGKAEVRSCTGLLKSGNWTEVHEKSVAAKETSLLEANTRNTALSDVSSDDEPLQEGNVSLDEVDGDRFEEEVLSADFTELVEAIAVDNSYTEERCKVSINSLNDILDKKVEVDCEELLKNEIVVFKRLKKELADKSFNLHKLFEQIERISSDKLIIKPRLEGIPRECIQQLYTINKTLYLHFKTILEKLQLMDEWIIINGSKENGLKKVIVEFIEIIKWINKQIFLIEKTVKVCFVKRF